LNNNKEELLKKEKVVQTDLDDVDAAIKVLYDASAMEHQSGVINIQVAYAEFRAAVAGLAGHYGLKVKDQYGSFLSRLLLVVVLYQQMC